MIKLPKSRVLGTLCLAIALACTLSATPSEFNGNVPEGTLAVVSTPPEQLECAFSSSTSPEKLLLNHIDSAKASIHVAMYSITDHRLAVALVSAATKGVDVRIVLDRSQAQFTASQANYLLSALGDKRVVLRDGRSGEKSIMHHKFVIFDKTTVATGSFNWTQAAIHQNYENLVVITDFHSQFEQEFSRISN